jgi:hypothetical protein
VGCAMDEVASENLRKEVANGGSDAHPRMWWLCWRNGVWHWTETSWDWDWLMTREHWMIYRGPSFLGVVWFGCSPMPSPPLSLQQVIFSFSQSSCLSLRERLAIYKSFNTLCYYWRCAVNGEWWMTIKGTAARNVENSLSYSSNISKRWSIFGQKC